MKKTLVRFGVVAALLAAPVAYAAGLFPNFPIVGGAAYCASLVNGSCAQQVPAGPSALTGDETAPFDTNKSQGRAPQTVLVKPGTLANFEQPPVAVAYATNTLTPDLSLSRTFTATLTHGAATQTVIGAPTNATPGQTWRFMLSQDATGSRTVSWNSKYKWPSGTAPTLTATVSKTDIVSCVYDGVTTTDHFCSTYGLNYTP